MKSILLLSFLAGCWQGEMDGAKVVERWGQPAGAMMLGTGHSVKGDKTVQYEFLEIREESGGTYYTPFINGQRVAKFRLSSQDSSHARFVNPENEWPKAIGYRLANDELTITLEGDRALEYTLRRTSCP